VLERYLERAEPRARWLHEEITSTGQRLLSRLAEDGAEPLVSTPEEYAADIDREESKWSAIVRAAGTKAE